MADIVIIGAGLTGLSTAYHLEKSGHTDYVLFEKEEQIGGLCGSVYQDGFTFDYTGHLLHISDPFFHSFINDIVGFDNLNAIHRRSFIYSHEVYTHYPFQVHLHGLPAAVIAECIEGFANRRTPSKEPRSFDRWVLKHFGPGLAKHFFFPFQQKIFDYPIEKVSPLWTGRFVPHTTLKEMITGALHKPSDSTIGYNSQFYYPMQGGIVFWIKKIATQLKQPIKTGYCASFIDMKSKVVHFSNGHSEPYKHLVTTIPLNTLLTSLKESTSVSLKRAARNLICNSVVNFNIGINRPHVSDKHWIYFPEKTYPFYRIGFGHNFSPHMTPVHCSSLYGEFSHIGKSQEYVKETLNICLQKTMDLFSLTPTDILTQKTIHISHAYVIYNFWRQRYLPALLETLAQSNIHSVGRYGAWKYSSMQEAVLDGRDIAEKFTKEHS